MRYIEENELTEESQAMADLIEQRFKNINRASKLTGFTRQTIYTWIKAGKISANSKDVLRGRGFDPETLLKISE